MYVIGHGGIEAWAISLMSIVSLLAAAVVIQGQGVEGAVTMLAREMRLCLWAVLLVVWVKKAV